MEVGDRVSIDRQHLPHINEFLHPNQTAVFGVIEEMALAKRHTYLTDYIRVRLTLKDGMCSSWLIQSKYCRKA